MLETLNVTLYKNTNYNFDNSSIKSGESSMQKRSESIRKLENVKWKIIWMSKVFYILLLY